MPFLGSGIMALASIVGRVSQFWATKNKTASCLSCWATTRRYNENRVKACLHVLAQYDNMDSSLMS